MVLWPGGKLGFSGSADIGGSARFRQLEVAVRNDRVAALVQQGKQEEARREAVAIPLEHIRTMALVLIERSRPLK